MRFDAAIADRLVRECRESARVLSAQRGAREAVTTLALAEFRGVFGDCFRENAAAEREAREGLIEMLGDLARQIEDAKAPAQRERERLDAVGLWEQTAAWGGGLTVDLGTRPSAVETPRPRVGADRVFQRTRMWVGGSGARGVSSADPDDLESAVQVFAIQDDTAEQAAGRVRAAVAAFEDACAWVVMDLAAVGAGLGRFTSDNHEDTSRVAGVAGAFRVAGGTGDVGPVTLSDRALVLSSTPGGLTGDALLAFLSTATPADLKALAVSRGWQQTLKAMDPAKIASWWSGMNPPGPTWGADGVFLTSPVQRSLLTGFPGLFGNLDGIPYGARDIANRIALDAEIAAARSALEKARAEADAAAKRAANDPSYQLSPQLLEAVWDLEARLATLTDIRKSLSQIEKGGAPRFLVGLDPSGTITGQIAIGNLDTAQNVTYALPGINTFGPNIPGWVKASQGLYNQITGADPARSQVMVAWVGARTPKDMEVFSDDRAISAGRILGRDLAGFNATRAGEGTGDRTLNIVGLSYGGLNAAEALHAGDYDVDTLVLVAPPGIPTDTGGRAGLHAVHVYAGMGDENTAGIGRNLANPTRVDPTDPASGYGATIFDTGASTGPDGEQLHGVNDHNAVDSAEDHKNGKWAYFDDKTTSLHNIALAVTGQEHKMTLKDTNQ